MQLFSIWMQIYIVWISTILRGSVVMKIYKRNELYLDVLINHRGGFITFRPTL